MHSLISAAAAPGPHPAAPFNPLAPIPVKAALHSMMWLLALAALAGLVIQSAMLARVGVTVRGFAISIPALILVAGTSAIVGLLT